MQTFDTNKLYRDATGDVWIHDADFGPKGWSDGSSCTAQSYATPPEQYGPYTEITGPKHTYTAFVTWDAGESFEEIDVVAINDAHARKLIDAALARDYVKGGQVRHIEQRINGTFF